MATDYDVSRAFRRIENELIDSMARNLKRHQVDEKKEGFTWEQWQALQLKELEKYRQENPTKFAKDFDDINKRIENAFRYTYQNAQTKEESKILDMIRKGKFTAPEKGVSGDFFGFNAAKFEHLINSTKADFIRGEWATLRQANDQYRKIIFDAQAYAATGATYAQAVDMATKDFMRAGIQSITYKNGARHNIADYSRMAIRTGQKRAYLMGEGDVHDKYGIHTVRVNKRVDACPLCVKWLGKVLVDDVYSGGTPEEAEKAGVPLLSEAIDEGFLHPNCKDIYTMYIEGVSQPADPWSKKEIKEITEKYNDEQLLNRAEDMRDSYERMARNALDPANQEKYQARADAWQTRIDTLRSDEKEVPEPVSEPPKPPIKFADTVTQEQREMLTMLAGQYDSRVTEVMRGTTHGAGEADAVSGILRLSSNNAQTTLHEFAHMIASSRTDKLGITDNSEFWKEIKKIHREYKKDVGDNVSRWISSYEHSSRGHDEFLAEAFTHAKMRELGLEAPSMYGTDYTYSQRVLDTVEKYFGKREATASVADVAEVAETITETIAETKAVFTPATTIEEAEAYAGRFCDTSQFGALGVSYEGVSIDVANTINETLGGLYDRYDLKEFGGIVAPKGNTKLGKMISGAQAAYSPVRNSFLLNRKSMKSAETIAKELKAEKEIITRFIEHPENFDLSKASARVKRVLENSAISGRGTVPETLEDIITHETGHALEKGLSKLDNFDIIKENMMEYAPKVSGYACDSLSEYIAESFCLYQKEGTIADAELMKAFKMLER